MKRPSLIAVDPGRHGAYAGHNEDNGSDWVAPLLMDSVHDLIGQFKFEGWLTRPRIAFIEKVGGFVGVAQPGSSAFAFGRNCGVIEGLLVALDYEIRWVRPQTWQGHFSALSRDGESKAQHKRRLRALAQERFPNLSEQISLVTCDALLLLAFAKTQLYREEVNT